MQYGGKTSWNMIYLTAVMLFKGKYTRYVVCLDIHFVFLTSYVSIEPISVVCQYCISGYRLQSLLQFSLLLAQLAERRYKI
jgi:hypothetical protein